jgi:uncharacterized protein
MPKKPVLSKAPLTDAHFAPLPFGAVKPLGAFLLRLKEAARWVGKTAWEDDKLPGFAALAYLAEDAVLKETVQDRVEKIIGDESAPETIRDVAGHASLVRGLIAWYGITADKKVLLFLMKQMQHIYRNADKLFAGLENAALTGEYVYAAICLFQWTGSSFLLRLTEKLRSLGLDWAGYFHTFPVTRPFAKHISPDELKKGLASADTETRGYYQKQLIMADGIALARGLKTPALLARFSGSSRELEAGKAGLDKVMRYHGTAHGLFAAEPSLMGGNPSCGIDGRAAAEAMFSLEQLLIAQGDSSFFDALEKIALNILPAMEKNGHIRPIMSVNGPFPQDHQPLRDVGPWIDAWLKGMTGYIGSLWMAAREDGLALMGYVPSQLRWKTNGIPIQIRVEGKYPLDGEIVLTVQSKKPVTFPLYLCIPAWAENAQVRFGNEETQAAVPGSFFVLKRTFCDGVKIYVTLPMKPRITRWHHQSASVEYGPLLMALSVDGEQPLWQLSLSPGEGLTSSLYGKPEEEQLKVAATFRRIPDWTAKDNRPSMPPIAPEAQGEALTLSLTPYSETVCRMAQFPLMPEA